MTLFSIDHLAQSDSSPSTNRFVSHPEVGVGSPNCPLPRPSSTGSSDAGTSDENGSSWDSASEASLPASPPETSNKKPPHSYISLIAMAILNSPDKRLLLCDIYEYITKRFPFFKDNERSWRNSIRHNLSLNECFIKAGRSGDGRGHFWAIHPVNMEDFARGDYRRRRARRRVRAAIHASTPYAYPSTIPNPVGFVPMTHARLSEVFPGTHVNMLPTATPYSSLSSPVPVPVPSSHYLHTPVLRPDVSTRLPTQIPGSRFPGSFPSMVQTPPPHQLSTLDAAHRWVPHSSAAPHLLPAHTFTKMPCPPTLMSASSPFTFLRSACAL